MVAPVVVAGVTTAVKSAPALASKAMEFVSKATNGRVTNVSQLAAYAKKGIAESTVVAQGMIQAGAPVAAVLPVDAINASKNRQMQEFLAQMSILAEAQGKRIDAQHGGLGDDPAADVLRMSLCKVAERRFGSIAAFRQIQMALETLTERDLALYEALKKA